MITLRPTKFPPPFNPPILPTPCRRAPPILPTPPFQHLCRRPPTTTQDAKAAYFRPFSSGPNPHHLSSTHFVPDSDHVISSSSEYTGPYRNKFFRPGTLFYRWSKPTGVYSTLNTDASSTGIGGLIRNSQGEAFVAFSSFIPYINDIDLAELWAIRRGLELAISEGVDYINIDTDSKRAVEYIYTAIEKCPVSVKNCVNEIQALLKSFVSWHCKHVFRETNKAADYLSRYATTAEEEGIIIQPRYFPYELKKIVEDDESGRLYVRENSLPSF
ncbi:hypothetical protein ACHQM5_015754 [Ranunculus cassubicifolius]